MENLNGVCVCVALGLTLCLIGIGIGIGSAVQAFNLSEGSQADEYSQYLGHNVSVQECNVTVWQGTMTQWWPNTIVVQEKCDPKMGNITIRKTCIVWIREGFECLLG